MPIAHPWEASVSDRKQTVKHKEAEMGSHRLFSPVQEFGNIDIPTNELSVLKAEAYKHHLSSGTKYCWVCNTLDCLLVGLLSFQ